MVRREWEGLTRARILTTQVSLECENVLEEVVEAYFFRGLEPLIIILVTFNVPYSLVLGARK